MAAYSTIPKITEIRKQEEMKPFSICKKKKKKLLWDTILSDLRSVKIRRNSFNWASCTDKMVEESIFDAYEKVPGKKKGGVCWEHLRGLKEHHFDQLAVSEV